MTAEARVGDKGVILEVEFVNSSGTAIDISSATTMQIILERPDSVVLTKTATFTTDGTDGKIRYTTVATDFAVAGTYYIQGRAVWSAGASDKKTAVGSFTVERAL